MTKQPNTRSEPSYLQTVQIIKAAWKLPGPTLPTRARRKLRSAKPKG